MEKKISKIIFRRLTKADFDHINHKGSHYSVGGGQSYIDFPTSNVSVNNWSDVLGQPTINNKTNRPEWNVEINSFGLEETSETKIYNRRKHSVCIASQKISSASSNRIPSWHPDNSFPVDYNPKADNLVVYIVRTSDGELWAGWFLKNKIPEIWPINDRLTKLFTENSAGFLEFDDQNVFVNTTYKDWPFYFDAHEIENQIKSEEDVIEDLAIQDVSSKLAEVVAKGGREEFVNKVTKIRKRNSKIVKELKKLYEGKCQISGIDLTFKKKNGEYYSEVHHLIPLGEDGSDSYANSVVISPVIHRMLHYANVSPIDLNSINNNMLNITINGVKYTITWHPEHMKTVERSLKD